MKYNNEGEILLSTVATLGGVDSNRVEITPILP